MARVPHIDFLSTSLGFDNYRVRSFQFNTPERFRYKWKPPPTNVAKEFVQVYKSHVTESPQTIVSPHVLLDVSETLTPLERVRVAFLEVLIGSIRGSSAIVDIIHEIASGQPNNFEQSFCVSLVALAGRTVMPIRVSELPLSSYRETDFRFTASHN